MTLFIDRLPLTEVRIGYAGETAPTWLPLIPVILTEPNRDQPSRDDLCRPWKLDTANALDASAWRFHIQQSGLNPFENLHPATVLAKPVTGQVESLPIRKACLWVVNNIPSLRDHPLRLDLYAGLPFRNRDHPDPRGVYPLIGIRSLQRAGLKIEVDFVRLTLSLWTPGAWHTNLGCWLRRLPDSFATIPLEHLCQENWRWTREPEKPT